MSEYNKTVRFLCYLIRHKTEIVDSFVGPDNWFRVDDVLECMKLNRRPINFDALMKAVAEDPTERFVFSDDYTKIKIDFESLPSAFIPIASFTTPEEAHFYKGFLENESIPCDLSEENIVGMNVMFSNVVGGVKLRVSRQNAERASLIVEEARTYKPEEKSLDEDNSNRETCPKCNSKDVYYNRITPGCFWGMVLFLGFPIPYKRQQWVCKTCHHTWK